ncbi:MAG TPA: hypothetical protein VFW40_06245 [Capsulimonadaceae bacterium]|nr:hypothetical protein [Capsulimonadaceae bacterium]
MPAQQTLLAQYADKAQSGELYTDPQWASWGDQMRRRRMIDHPSLGTPALRQAPTFDDLMFRIPSGQGPNYRTQTNDSVYRVPNGTVVDWQHISRRLTDYRSAGQPQGSSTTKQPMQRNGGLMQLKAKPFPNKTYTLDPEAIEKAKNKVQPPPGKRPLTPKEQAYFENFKRNAAQ